MILSLFLVHLNLNLRQVDIEADAYFRAHQNQKVSSLYESIELKDLQEWQRARLIYNQGVVALSQQDVGHGLELLFSVQPSQLLKPEYVKDLLLNQGLGLLALSRQESLKEKQIYLTQKASQFFDLAIKMKCPSIASNTCLQSEKLKDSIELAEALRAQYQKEKFQQFEKGLPQFSKVDPLEQSFKKSLFLVAEGPLKQGQLDQLTANHQKELDLLTSAKKKFDEDHQLEVQIILLGLLSIQLDEIADRFHDPSDVLKNGIFQVDFLLTAVYLSSFVNQYDQELLKMIHQHALKEAQRFLSAVQDTQKSQYQTLPKSELNCQEDPWKHIIPVFAQGYEALLASQSLLFSNKIEPNLELTLTSWRHALDLLEKGPNGASIRTATTKNSAETLQNFQLLQEMFNQDVPEQTERQAEVPGW